MYHSLAQLAVAVLFGVGIEGHCHKGAFFEDVFYQVGQYCFGTKFNKNLPAVGINAFDFIFKEHRVEHMSGEDALDFIRVAVVALTAGIGIEGDLGLFKPGFLNGGGEGLLGVFDQRGMEGGRNRQQDHRIAFTAEGFLNLGDGLFTAGQHHLGIGIPIGQGDIWKSLDIFQNLVDIGFDGQHGARVEIVILQHRRHGLAACQGKGQVILVIDHAGSPQGGQLAKTVPGHKIGLVAGLLQQFVQPHAERADGGLRMFSAHQVIGQAVFGGLVKDRGWKDACGKGRQAGFNKQAVHAGDHLAHGRKITGQFTPHLEILRALTGEEGHHFSFGIHAALAVINTFGMFPGRFTLLAQQVDAALQHFLCIEQRAGDKTQAGVFLGHHQALRLGCQLVIICAALV